MRFPQSGSDLGYPPRRLPTTDETLRLTPDRAPHRRGLPTKLVPPLQHGEPSPMPGAGSEPPSAQSPFTRLGRYLQRRDVTHPFDRHYPAVLATTNSCASPHPSRQPQFVSLVPSVLAGCGQPLLGCVPSRRYLHNPCCVAWTPTPQCSFGAYPFLPEGQRPRHRDEQLGTPDDLCKATSAEGTFRGCSHSLMFRLHNSLGPQVAPTARPLCVLGGRAVYTRPNSGRYRPRALASLRA